MKKGVVLIVVIGIMMVMFILGLVALYLMTQESRLAEHKIRRSRAFFAAQAGTIHAMTQLRQGVTPDTTLSLGTRAEQGFPYPVNVDIDIGQEITDPASPYVGTRPVNVTVDY